MGRLTGRLAGNIDGPWFRAGVLGVVVFHILLYGVILSEAVMFKPDMKRDLTRVQDAVTLEQFEVQGPEWGPGQYTLGSMTTLILAVPGVLSTDPAFVHLAFVLLSAAALVMFGLALREVARPEIVILTLCFIVGSGLWFHAHISFWQPSLLPGFLALFMLSGQRVLAGAHPAWALGLIAGPTIAVQLHPTAFLLPFLAVAVILACHRRLGPRWLVASGVMGAVLSAPFLAALVAAADPAAAGDGAELGQELGNVFAHSNPDGMEVISVIAAAMTPDYTDQLGLFPSAAWTAYLTVFSAAAFLLAAIGIGVAIFKTRGLTFQRFLVMATVLGAIGAGLGLVWAHDYRCLHVTNYFLLALAALGLEWVARRWPPRATTVVAASVGAVIVAAGLFRPVVPLAPLCNVSALSEVSQALVAEYGALTRADVDGWPCHWGEEVSLRAASRGRERTLPGTHRVLVRPPGRRQSLPPDASEALTFQSGGQKWAAHTYPKTVLVEDKRIVDPMALRESRQVKVEVKLARAVSVLHVQFTFQDGQECAVTADSRVATATDTIRGHAGHPVSLYEVPIQGGADDTIEIEITGCDQIDDLEVY